MRFAFGMALISAMFFTLGCGGSGGDSKKIAVKGKLMSGSEAFVLDQAKLKLPKGTSVPPGARLIRVSFVPADGSGETAPATVDDATGTFTASLAPGNYKVVITAGAGPGSPDYFDGKHSLERTQIRREVKEGEDIVIDVLRPQG